MYLYKMKFYLMLILALFITVSASIAQVNKIDFRREQDRDLNARQTKNILEKNKLVQSRVDVRKQLEKGIVELDALDGIVNSESYLVGPGDVFSINVLSAQPDFFETLVGPEGTVDLPGYKTLSVANKNLNEAKMDISNAVREIYSNSEIFVSLTNVRLIKIYVTGAVMSPGAVSVKAMDRVVDLILRIGGTTEYGKMHEIHVKHKDGSEEILNGYDYIFEGNQTSNPILREGDVIYIPKADIMKETITVQGASIKPGPVPFIGNETVYDFLKRYENFGEKLNIDLITISRNVDGQQTYFQIDISNRHIEVELKDLKLQAGDVLDISFLPEVYIYGQVVYPGNYPYVAGYKVVDYIGLAGGNNRDGSRKAYVLRDDNKIKGLNTPVERGDIIIVPQSMNSLLVGRLSLLQISYTFISTLISIIILSERI